MPNMAPRTRKAIEEPITEEFIVEPIEADESLDSEPFEETFTFKRSHFYALMTVFAFSAGILLGYVVWGMDSAGTNSQITAQASGSVVEAPVTAEPKFVRYDVPSDGFPAL